MISYLKGIPIFVENNLVTIDVNGVGYEVYCTAACLKKLQESFDKQESAAVLIFTDVKEDLIRLYGFNERIEKQVFNLLLKVNGVGAKTACELLSQIDCRELLKLIANSDHSQLQKIKGVGKKTAERIVVELKDLINEYLTHGKLAEATKISSEIKLAGRANNKELLAEESDALHGLISLGFSQKDAQIMLNKAIESIGSLIEKTEKGKNKKENLTASELLKLALQFI